jgi:hypothetical protein
MEVDGPMPRLSTGAGSATNDRHPKRPAVRLDRWTPEPERTLDRSMASLPPEKGVADR